MECIGCTSNCSGTQTWTHWFVLASSDAVAGGAVALAVLLSCCCWVPASCPLPPGGPLPLACPDLDPACQVVLNSLAFKSYVVCNGAAQCLAAKLAGWATVFRHPSQFGPYGVCPGKFDVPCGEFGSEGVRLGLRRQPSRWRGGPPCNSTQCSQFGRYGVCPSKLAIPCGQRLLGRREGKGLG